MVFFALHYPESVPSGVFQATSVRSRWPEGM